MRFLLAILLSLFWSVAQADVDCFKHPICCQIIKNNKYLDINFAMQLSNAIHKISRKYNINSRLFTAILMQESSYNVKAIGCHYEKKDINAYEYMERVVQCHTKTDEWHLIEQCEKRIPKKVKRKVCSDFGIGQINERTVQRYNFEINSLLYDLEYSVEAAAIVLKDFQKRYKHKEWNWWTRYNASSEDKREIYRHKVEKYL